MMQLLIFNLEVFVRKYKAIMISTEHLLCLRYSCKRPNLITFSSDLLFTQKK